MKKWVLFLVTILHVSVPRMALAGSVAPRHRPRCGQTSGAFLERIIKRAETGSELLADASHLLPHLEIGYVPFAARATEHATHLMSFQHVTIAAKPSLSVCLLEAHITAEAILGSDEDHGTEKLHERVKATSFGWRIGAEAFTRPSRWVGESLRFFDPLALGFGATFGGIISDRQPMLGIDRALELGPRLLFDVNEWLAFVLAINLHVRPVFLREQAEIGVVAHGAIQLSFPSHILFGNDHETH